MSADLPSAANWQRLTRADATPADRSEPVRAFSDASARCDGTRDNCCMAAWDVDGEHVVPADNVGGAE